MRYGILFLLLLCSVLELFAADAGVRALSGRTVYRRGETIPLVFQVRLTAAAPQAEIALLLEEHGARTQIALDRAGALPVGPYSRYYELNSSRLRVGVYRVVGVLISGESREEAAMPLEIVSETPLTDFVIPHINFQPWMFPPKMSAGASYQRYSFNFSLANLADFWNRHDKPELTGNEASAEDLLRFGVDFLKYPTGYGWGLSHAPLRGGASWRDPDVIEASAQLMQYHTQASRRFPNFLGMNPIDEPVVPWTDRFMTAEFTRLTGHPVPKQEDVATNPALVSRYQQYRNEVIELFDREMKAAMREVQPHAKMANQTFADILTGSGLYPNNHVSLDIQSTHIYDHWPTSNNWMSFAVNLRRANRPVFGARPLWVYTGCYGIVEDQWRAAWALALSEKVEGHGYFLGAGEMSEGLPWVEYSIAEMVRLNRINTQYGNFLLALEKPVEPLALWYSLAQAGASPPSRAYEQQVVGAYFALKRAHFPVTVITDEDVRAGLLKEHRVLMLTDAHYLPEDLLAAVHAFRAGGGRIVSDNQSTLEFPALTRLSVNFREFAATQTEIGQAWTENQPVSMLLRRDLFSDASIIRQLPILDQELSPLVARPVIATSHDTFISVQRQGEASYVFLANEASVYGHTNEGRHWITMQESVPAVDRITMPFARGKAVYDLFTGERLMLDAQGSVTLRLPMGGLRVLCVFPKPLQEPQLSVTRTADGAQLEVSASARGAGVIPAELQLHDAQGALVQRRFVAVKLARNDSNRWSYRLAENDPSGAWKVSLRNVLSGQTTVATVNVPAKTAVQGIVNALTQVKTYDERSYAPFIKRPGLLIVPGEGYDEHARILAAALNAEVRQPDDILKPDVYPELLDPEKNKGVWMMPRPKPLNLSAGANLIVLGEPGNNSVLKELNTSGMLSQPIYPATLGKGQGVVQYVWSPFDRGKDVVMLAAIDAEGMTAASQRFLSIARGDKGLLDEPIPLPASLAQSGTVTAPAAGLEVVQPAMHVRLEDSVRKLATGGDILATAGQDSYLTVFDAHGTQLWRRDLGYRVIGVTVSADGAYIAAAAFPRTYLFNRQGQLIYYKSANYPSQDDAEGLAVFGGELPDKGTLRLLQGSWSGKVQGFAANGSRMWTFPVVPKEATDPAPAPLSPIRSIAQMGNGNYAIGAMKEVVLLDADGKEIKRQAFDRVQSLCAAGDGLLVATFKRKLALLDAAGETRWQKETPDFIMAAAASVDGTRFALALFSGEVQVYDQEGNVLRHARLPFDANLTGVVFNRAGTQLWLSTWDGDLLSWQL